MNKIIKITLCFFVLLIMSACSEDPVVNISNSSNTKKVITNPDEKDKDDIAVKPVPVNPTPVEPVVPVNPTPVEPVVPVNPTPVNPVVPVNPTPVDPAPVNPVIEKPSATLHIKLIGKVMVGLDSLFVACYPVKYNAPFRFSVIDKDLTKTFDVSNHIGRKIIVRAREWQNSIFYKNIEGASKEMTITNGRNEVTIDVTPIVHVIGTANITVLEKGAIKPNARVYVVPHSKYKKVEKRVNFKGSKALEEYPSVLTNSNGVAVINDIDIAAEDNYVFFVVSREPSWKPLQLVKFNMLDLTFNNGPIVTATMNID